MAKLMGVLIVAEKSRAMNRVLVAVSCAALGGAAATGAYIGVITGRLTLDLGIGRLTRPFGPLRLNIAAPRETVFAAAAAPYADRQPRDIRAKVEISNAVVRWCWPRTAPPSDPV